MANADRRRPLRAGPLYAEYHRGDLWSARFGDVPALDRLYVRIRDQAWGTVPMSAELAALDRAGSTFRVVARLCWGAEPWATGTLEVTGSASELCACATITFHRRVRLQRAGLNLHHPLAGTVGRAYHWADGRSSGSGTFPAVIHPQLRDQAGYLPMIGPFRRLTVGTGPHSQLTMDFAGARFETEDQRNWTDASFKTYGPPVDRQEPRWHEAGSVIRQTVLITARAAGPAAARPSPRTTASPAVIRIGAGTEPPLPPVGVTASSLWPGPDAAPGLTGPDHVRVDVWPDSAAPAGQLRHTLAAIRDGGLCLELALHGGAEAHGPVARVLRLAQGIPVRAILALGPGTDPVTPGFAAMVRDLARQAGLPAPVAVGTAGHFSEINRFRETIRHAGPLVWSTTPQVHETDDLTIMQAAPIVGQTVASAARIWPDQGRAVSCIRFTAGPHTGPSAGPHTEASSRPHAGPGRGPAADPRAAGPFAAAWLLAVLDGLTGTRCDWLTVDLPLVTARPARRPAPTPAAAVLRALRHFRGLPLARVHGTGPGLAVLAAREPGGTRLLMANLTRRRSVPVILPGPAWVARAGASAPLRIGFSSGGQTGLNLGPYEVIHLIVPS
jgi:hypothetical protein